MMLTGNDVREKFIAYFRDKLDHKHLPSSGLIPDNPTVMLTTAGMLQFVPIFLGYEDPPTPPRAVTYQKCARAGGKDSDIENVGRTPRHHTFFEMLGNFSFGDYFKKEIIPWSWEFVTKELKLEKDKLWVTVYQDDDESFAIWRDDVGVPEERILRCGKKDNFWGPPGPTGPCGPCTEIHYDLGEQYKCDAPKCIPNECECDRFVEIWNLVLMELFLDEEGHYTPLTKKNVDTGMGLERITMCVQNKTSTFETDLLQPILDKVCSITQKSYNNDKKTDVSLRIITDHARCVTFLVCDGLTPGNIGRNYVLRMILRRALRHGKILGVKGTFLHQIVDTVINRYKQYYPELETSRDKIVDIIKAEEERFEKTVDRGITLLEGIIEKVKSEKKSVISGADAFMLYDTYGFPMELTVEIAAEQDLKVDVAGFQTCMQEQKERAKQAHVAESLTSDLVYADILKEKGGTVFAGYDGTSLEKATVISLIKDGKRVERASEGELVEVVLDKTPFYAESGGQVGDTGLLKNDSTHLHVINTQKYEDLLIHKSEVTKGTIKEGDSIGAMVSNLRRNEIAVHHTATHLVHAALKLVLGDEVNQAGSSVSDDRARFDFSFNKALSPDQIKKIEGYVNKWIQDAVEKETLVMTPEEAKAAGAIALFGEKYGDTVRVVKFKDVSQELCGGTHVENTSKLNLCKVVSESAIAAGVRRLELVCGKRALAYLAEQEDQVQKLSAILKVPTHELAERVEKLMDDLKASDKKVKELTAEMALTKVNSLINQAEDIDGAKFISARLDNIAAGALKTAAESLSDKLGNSVVVLASHDQASGKIAIVAKVSDPLTKQGYNAGKIVNELAVICGGRGGGKPNFAQAGAKDPSKLDEAVSKAKELVLNLVKV